MRTFVLFMALAIAGTALVAAAPTASAACLDLSCIQPCTATFPQVCVNGEECSQLHRYGCVVVRADCAFWGTCGPPP